MKNPSFLEDVDNVHILRLLSLFYHNDEFCKRYYENYKIPSNFLNSIQKLLNSSDVSLLSTSLSKNSQNFIPNNLKQSSSIISVLNYCFYSKFSSSSNFLNSDFLTLLHSEFSVDSSFSTPFCFPSLFPFSSFTPIELAFDLVGHNYNKKRFFFFI
jgi:hypothetical protein